MRSCTPNRRPPAPVQLPGPPRLTGWRACPRIMRLDPAGVDCGSFGITPLFAWGDARDRRAGTNYTSHLAPSTGGATVFSRNDLTPAACPLQWLAAGGRQLRVVRELHADRLAPWQSTQWRRFTIESLASKRVHERLGLGQRRCSRWPSCPMATPSPPRLPRAPGRACWRPAAASPASAPPRCRPRTCRRST